ncbi:hypothetical protein ACTAQI_20260 [Pseudarthrobacter sp. alpha12b]
MSDMVAVLLLHQDHTDEYAHKCSCGWSSMTAHTQSHQAAALSAAGFGPVKEAKAEALRDAAANILTNDPLDYWNGHLPEGLGFQEAMSHWLKAHAKAILATS